MVREAENKGTGSGADGFVVMCGLALDATGAMNGNCDWEDAPLDLLRVCVRTSTAQAGFVDIVCADTGGGIRTHHIKALCCGAFETTKRAGGDQAAVTAGKYGDLAGMRWCVALYWFI
jgi:hypothetical protein